MKKLIASFLLLSFLPLNGLAAFTNSDRAEFTGRNLLADHNPGAENGKAGWTVSSGSFTASTSSPLEGNASFVWDASAASQTFTSASVTIPEGWKGLPGVVSCRLQCATSACTHTITAWDGAANIFTPVPINVTTTGSLRTSPVFNFPSSGSVALRLTSSADEPSLKIDSCIAALADGTALVTGPPMTRPVAYTPIFTGLGTTTNINFLYWQEGAQGCIRGNWTNGTVTATEARVSLPSGWTTPASLPTLSLLAPIGRNANSATFFSDYVTIEPSVTYVTISSQTSSTHNLTKQTGSNAFASSENVSIPQVCFSVSGFDSNFVMASSTNNGTTTSKVTTSSHTGGFSANTTGTYTTPAGTVQIEVCGVGAGGGGAGSGSAAGTAATDGTATTFGTSLISLPGGTHGVLDKNGGAGGGAPTINSPAVAGVIGLGGYGGASVRQGSSTTAASPGLAGSHGGSSALGGAGSGGAVGDGNPAAAQADTGAGGGGGGISSVSNGISGAGGGAGTYACATIKNPLPTYSYTVGTHGNKGALGTSGAQGADAADGQLVVKESYLPNPAVGLNDDSIVTQAASYTLTATDRTVIFSGLGGGATATLPNAAQFTGRVFRIKNADTTNDVTINTTSSQLIDGRASGVIVLKAPYNDSISVVSDGSNWKILAKAETQVLTSSGSHTSATGAITGIYQSGSANVTLTYGKWRVSCLTGGSMSAAGSTNFMQLTSAFFSADGANSASTPAALGLTILGSSSATPSSIACPTNGTAACVVQQAVGPFITTVTSNSAAYCVPAVGVSSGTVTVSSQIFAERIW